jgi:hypothetical protein
MYRIECNETRRKDVRAIGFASHLRWKIENEGFNTQKCGDNAMQNYYTLLQIAHTINQFTEKQKGTKALLKERSKETLCNLWCKLKDLALD